MHRVLVLGASSTASYLAQGLKRRGFKVHFGDPCAQKRIQGASSWEALGQVLQNFSRNFSSDTLWVHPGTSLWGEHLKFLQLASQKGLRVIGPSESLASFQDQWKFFQEVSRLQIPHVVQSFEVLKSYAELTQWMKGSENPWTLRSVARLGSLGYFLAEHGPYLERSFELWLEQLRLQEVEPSFFIQRFFSEARHLVIPFVRLPTGEVQFFPITDASLQQGSSKIIEFCPVFRLSNAVRSELFARTKRLAENFNYVGLGSFEYLVEAERSYLVEVTPRLSTHFALWEQVTKTRVVDWQLAALGFDFVPALKLSPQSSWSVAIALRLCAKDSVYHLPQPGKIEVLGVFSEENARLDWNYQQGEEVAYDHLGFLGILLVEASHRKLAMIQSIRSLDRVWIAGGLKTNERFLLEILRHPWVESGIFHRGFLDEEFVPSTRPPRDYVSFAMGLCEKKVSTEVRWSAAGEWVKEREDAGDAGLQALAEASLIRYYIHQVDALSFMLRIQSWQFDLRASQKEKAFLRACVSGRVHFLGSAGLVPRGQLLVVIESMGFLVPQSLTQEVQLGYWQVQVGDQVLFGQALAHIQGILGESYRSVF